MEARLNSEDDPAPDWRMHLVDLVSGARRPVTSSPKIGGRPPSPQIDRDWLVWVQASATGKGMSDVMVLNLADPGASATAILRKRPILDCGVTDGLVVVAMDTAGRVDLFSLRCGANRCPAPADVQRPNQAS